MKLLVLCLLLTPVFANDLPFVDADLDFDMWVARNNKLYDSPAEYEYRRQVFADNMKLAAQMQAEDEGSAEFGATIFSDLTPEEFADQWLTLSAPPDMSLLPEAVIPDIEAPASKDWRKEGAVHEIRNQGRCGSCWAFASIASIEGVCKVKKGKLQALSEQQLVDCDTQSHGCRGGWMYWAYEYVIKAGGLCSQSDYKYTGRDESCKDDPSKHCESITGWEKVTGGEDNMRKYSAQNGPIAIAVDATWMQSYKSGIFSGRCGSRVNHAINIVGWGEDGGGHMILRNSWGNYWGEKGYARLAYGCKCGTCDYVQNPTC